MKKGKQKEEDDEGLRIYCMITSLLRATDHLPVGTGAYNVTVPYCPLLHRRGGNERLKCIIDCVTYCAIHVQRHVTRHIYLRYDRTGA